MPSPKQILLAEDDIQYAFVIQLALRQAGIEDPVHLVTTREQVIAYMAGENQYADRHAFPVPIVIILAIRLPLLHDFKALRWIRKHHQFDEVRVVVLSGVEYNNERAVAEALGADCYHVKPEDFSGLVRIAQHIRQRWLEPAPQLSTEGSVSSR